MPWRGSRGRRPLALLGFSVKPRPPAPLEAGFCCYRSGTWPISRRSRPSRVRGPARGVARATRRAGKVPGVIYGAKQEPTLIALDPRVVLKELKRGGWRSRLYEIGLAGEKTRALMRDVQFHPVTDAPEHVDFQRLAAGERIRVAVQVVFLNEGTSPGLKRGGVLNVVRHSVEVACDPDNIPERFEADLGQLDINDNVRWHNLAGIGEGDAGDCGPRFRGGRRSVRRR